MEHDKSLRLLLRQLKDIQVQAEKIMRGEDSNESIESFAKYSAEFKAYIQKNVDSAEIRRYADDLPQINYQRTQIKLWQYVILPSWWISLYKDYHAKNIVIQEIIQATGKYGTLELLVQGSMQG